MATAPDQPEPTSTLDVETYISNYTGVTRLKRLAFIAAHSPSLKADALRIALDEVKRTTNNSALYLELVALGDPATTVRDDAWVDSVDRKAAQTLEKLEADLANHKTSLVKESIRMGHTDLGEFHFERGDFQTAFKCFVRTRDYCTTSKHVIAMCLGVIRVSIHMGNFTHVTNYITKAESTPDISDTILTAQLKVAAGLGYLYAQKYKLAARKFVEVSPELGSAFSDVASQQDVALYGGLCALASFDRAELKNKLIDNGGFRTLLELFPEVRELVRDFYNSKYASCLQYLKKLRPDLLLDLHLHDHVEPLLAAIHSKALVQYFSPYVRVNMNQMAAAFSFGVDELESELAKLIGQGQIQARIDSHNKVLYARHDDQRSATFTKALSMGEEYMRDTKALLLRINLMRHDFIVRGNGDTLGPSKSSRQEQRQERAQAESMAF